MTETHFERPGHFDLATYWSENTKRLEAELYATRAKVRVSPMGMRILEGVSSAYIRESMTVSDDADAEGFRIAELFTGTESHAVFDLLRVGPELEVLEPPELRDAMFAATRKMLDLYR